jgi:hypothetical protein
MNEFVAEKHDFWNFYLGYRGIQHLPNLSSTFNLLLICAFSYTACSVLLSSQQLLLVNAIIAVECQLSSRIRIH